MAGTVKYIPTYTYERSSQYPALFRNHQTGITMYCNSRLFEFYNSKLATPEPSHTTSETIGTWTNQSPNFNVFSAANIVLNDNVFSSALRCFYAVTDDNLDISNTVDDMLIRLGVNKTKLDINYYTVVSDYRLRIAETIGLNNYVYRENTNISKPYSSGYRCEFRSLVGGLDTGALYHVRVHQNLAPQTGENYYNEFYIYVAIFPDDVLAGNIDENTLAYEADNKVPINVILHGSYARNTNKFSGTLEVQRCATNVSSNAFKTIRDYFGGAHPYNENGFTGETDLTPSEDDPYGIKPSGPGGGDGTGDPDLTEPVPIPELPSIGANDLGFITMYNPTVAQIKDLSEFMWSNAFDLVTYKKLFSDPMQSIIGLAIVPVAPDISGAKTVKFGTIDSEVSMSTVGNQYKEIDCGWCDIEKWIGSFMDYSPYTKISLYLPYIGIKTLSADDIMGSSIHVVYHVDLLTGACAAFVEDAYRGVLYSYNGSCITNVPLTAQNFSGAIQNAVSAVVSAAGMVAGMVTGAAPVTAMSAAGLLNSAANTALNSKPEIQRSGNLGGSAGILSVQFPYLIIERPNISVPSGMEHYIGQTSNVTCKLGNISGFTIVDYIHLHGVEATNEELAEIESILKKGVIL